MIILTVLYGLLAISWLASLLISGDTKATVLHVILGMVALFSKSSWKFEKQEINFPALCHAHYFSFSRTNFCIIFILLCFDTIGNTIHNVPINIQHKHKYDDHCKHAEKSLYVFWKVLFRSWLTFLHGGCIQSSNCGSVPHNHNV